MPADLAAQYGEKVNVNAQARTVALPAPTRRPRRTAAAREKMKQVLQPDEDIIARLARANTIGITRKRSSSRRSKTWQARCGRCGTSRDFAIAAALCSKCGAILIRED